MKILLSAVPEIQDPNQLDIFGKESSSELQEDISSYHSADETKAYHTRDPTVGSEPDQGSGVRKAFDLNEAQSKLSGALHRKSRALVSKNFQALIQEENEDNSDNVI